MEGFTLEWPAWLGSPSQVALLVIVIVTLIKTWPIIQRNILDAKERRESRYSQRISELEKAVTSCQQECEDHKEELRQQIGKLERQRLDDRAQNLQEQISLVAILVKNVDNPMLAQILETLQAHKRRLPMELTGIIGDTQSPTK